MRGPNPYGLSGGGLWIIKSEGNKFSRPYLIGILSEYLKTHSLYSYPNRYFY